MFSIQWQIRNSTQVKNFNSSVHSKLSCRYSWKKTRSMANTALLWLYARGKSAAIPQTTGSLFTDVQSALFSMYDAALKNCLEDDVAKMRITDSMESASVRLTDFSILLFADPETKDIRHMSPLIPYSLYQAAIIQYRSWVRNHEIFCKQRLDSLVKILGYFKKRWLVAGKPPPNIASAHASLRLEKLILWPRPISRCSRSSDCRVIALLPSEVSWPLQNSHFARRTKCLVSSTLCRALLQRDSMTAVECGHRWPKKGRRPRAMRHTAGSADTQIAVSDEGLHEHLSGG